LQRSADALVEKATVLRAEFSPPGRQTGAGRYSRHYYDVAMMAGGPVKTEATCLCLAAVVKREQTFYNRPGLSTPSPHLGPSGFGPPKHGWQRSAKAIGTCN